MPIPYTANLINRVLVNEASKVLMSRDKQLSSLLKQEKDLRKSFKKEKSKLERLAEESLKMTELYSNYGSKVVETLEEYKKINGKKQPKRKKNKGIKINKYKNERKKIKKKIDKNEEKRIVTRIIKKYYRDTLNKIKMTIKKRKTQIRKINKVSASKKIAKALKKSKGR